MIYFLFIRVMLHHPLSHDTLSVFGMVFHTRSSHNARSNRSDKCSDHGTTLIAHQQPKERACAGG